MHIWVFRNTNLLSIVPTVVEKQLVFRRDVLGGAEIDFSIMGISHQILFFPVPGFANKHHPITFIFICCNDAEFQDTIMVYLPDMVDSLVCPLGYFHGVALLTNQRPKASPHRNGFCSPYTNFCSYDGRTKNKLLWEGQSCSALYGCIRNKSHWSMIRAV